MIVQKYKNTFFKNFQEICTKDILDIYSTSKPDTKNELLYFTQCYSVGIFKSHVN